jgi:hypothetical protein
LSLALVFFLVNGGAPRRPADGSPGTRSNCVWGFLLCLCASPCLFKAGLYGACLAAGAGTERQKALIDRAIAALEEALSLADQGEPLDLIAPALREAVNALGEITGEVSAEELLDAMFSRFCVGK